MMESSILTLMKDGIVWLILVCGKHNGNYDTGGNTRDIYCAMKLSVIKLF